MAQDAEPVLLDTHETEGTVTLTLSGGEILEIAADSLPSDLPQVGAGIPPLLLVRLRTAAESKQISRRLFQILDRRLYSTAVLRTKLTQEGFSPAGVEAVLAKFAEAGLHSDHLYAMAYCRDTWRRQPVGRRYLQAKLHREGVPTSVVGEVLDQLLTPQREEELALAASRKRWARIPTTTGPTAEAKVYRFLLNRGFSRSTARKAAREGAAPGIDEDREDEA